MAIYDVRLLEKRAVAEGTMEFILSKPNGFQYRAGQFFDIVLPAPAGTAKQDHVHGFSFVSAPFEENLAAATRMRATAFKNSIRELPEGSQLSIEASWGKYILHRDASVPAVFLIGGVGITPVRSMVAQALHDGGGPAMTLLYANRTPALAPFTADFEAFAQQAPNFRFVPVYTQAASGNGAEHGHIDAAMIRRHVPDLQAPLYYLSGPAGMVRAMIDVLRAQGIEEEKINTEEFEGY